MGTIIERKRKDGTVGYAALIRIKQKGKVVHSEAQTFDRRRAAENWIAKKEAALAEPGALEKEQSGSKGVTLGDTIDKYIKASAHIGKTKTQVLRTIKQYDVADMPVEQVDSAALLDFATQIAARGVKPQTVQTYLSHLAAVFAIAQPAWNIPLNQSAMRDAMTVARRLGTTAKGNKRERRPTLDELDKIMGHFQDIQDRGSRTRPFNPMHKITAFALFSTRRQEEITRIRWGDLDVEHSRVLVRDMKHPGQKIGNHVWVDLPAEALAIIQAMPRKKEQIFPYSTDAISAAFTRACQFLQIEDLTFHDLRHEGVSRLFELGLGIPQVAAVSGHRSWSSLQRYTHIRQTGDKYERWKWLEHVTREDLKV